MIEEDKVNTAFHTMFGLNRCKLMPCDLGKAPAISQSIMNDIFIDLFDNGVIVYLNYLLIYTENIAKHVPYVQEVLSQLNKPDL